MEVEQERKWARRPMNEQALQMRTRKRVKQKQVLPELPLTELSKYKDYRIVQELEQDRDQQLWWELLLHEGQRWYMQWQKQQTWEKHARREVQRREDWREEQRREEHRREVYRREVQRWKEQRREEQERGVQRRWVQGWEVQRSKVLRQEAQWQEEWREVQRQKEQRREEQRREERVLQQPEQMRNWAWEWQWEQEQQREERQRVEWHGRLERWERDRERDREHEREARRRLWRLQEQTKLLSDVMSGALPTRNLRSLCEYFH